MPISLEKDDWLAKVDGAMTEAAEQSERARSRAESDPKRLGDPEFDPYTDGYPSPDLMHAHVQREFQPDLLAAAAPASTRIDAEDEWESHDHLFTSSSTSHSESESDTPEEGADLESDGSDYFEGQNANDSSDITKMDQERVRRQEELLEQMRKVLDGQQESRCRVAAFETK